MYYFHFVFICSVAYNSASDNTMDIEPKSVKKEKKLLDFSSTKKAPDGTVC